MQVADLREQHFVPAAARGIAGIVEVAFVASLSVADHRHALGQDRRVILAHLSHELGQRISGRGQDLGNGLRARPALLAFLGDPLALVESGGVESRTLGQARGRHSMFGGEPVDGAPDICMFEHLPCPFCAEPKKMRGSTV